MKSTLHRRAKGNIGEDTACRYLEKQGFVVAERNFRRKWGELDIIAKKDNILHFFEVKSVAVLQSDKQIDLHKPEDNVDGWKIKHLRRIIETYLSMTDKGLESTFQFHVLCVYMNYNNRMAKVEWLKNLIL